MNLKGFNINGNIYKYDYDSLENKLELDETLSVSGQAADAKTVGDKFAETEVTINEVTEKVNEVTEQIGDLTTLTTTEQGSIVGAINEVNSKTPFIVNITAIEGSPYTADKTLDEIFEAYNAGATIIACENNQYLQPMVSISSNDNNSFQRVTFAYVDFNYYNGYTISRFGTSSEDIIESETRALSEQYQIKIDTSLLNTESKNIVEAINEVREEALSITPSDWNQNDEAAVDYIKNRTHYSIDEAMVEISTATVANSVFETSWIDDVYGYCTVSDFDYDSSLYDTTFALGSTVTLKVNDTVYTGIVKECTDTWSSKCYHRVIGNTSIVGIGEDTGESFLYVLFTRVTNSTSFTIKTPSDGRGHAADLYPGYLFLPVSDILESNAVSIGVMQEGELKQLDEKFIPDTIARTEQIGNTEELETESKTVVDAINEVNEKASEVTTPDWNQNDETAADYIKNRTHYYNDNSSIIIDTTSMVLNTNVEITTRESVFNDVTYITYLLTLLNTNINIVEGEQYEITLNGKIYTCVGSYVSCSTSSHSTIGLNYYDENLDGQINITNVENIIAIDSNLLPSNIDFTTTVPVVTVKHISHELKQLDEKYVPDTIARTEHIGNTEELETEDKTVVGAINEVNEKAVSHNVQTLSEQSQNQARANIGAYHDAVVRQQISVDSYELVSLKGTLGLSEGQTIKIVIDGTEGDYTVQRALAGYLYVGNDYSTWDGESELPHDFSIAFDAENISIDNCSSVTHVFEFDAVIPVTIPKKYFPFECNFYIGYTFPFDFRLYHAHDSDNYIVYKIIDNGSFDGLQFLFTNSGIFTNCTMMPNVYAVYTNINTAVPVGGNIILGDYYVFVYDRKGYEMFCGDHGITPKDD